VTVISDAILMFLFTYLPSFCLTRGYVCVGGRPKNFSVVSNAGPEVMARCTLFRSVRCVRSY